MTMSEPVVIVAYDPTWPAQVETAACVLRETVGALLVAIEHVGSTAVLGLAAKPIIDMMAFVPRFEDGFTTVAPLVARGWESLGEYGIPGRHYFRRRRGGRATHHLHM
ncbi:MAG: GrpB family protein, partial [Chloroflexi bacterium]|nr:GrpB family protein [Chloroflexota bacterium]